MAATPKVPEAEIIACIRKGMTYAEIARKHGLHPSGGTFNRMEAIAKRLGLEVAKAYPTRALKPEDQKARDEWERKLQSNARKPLTVTNGTVLIGSDAHYYPGIVSTAHRGFCRLAKELKPVAVILNGDAFDGGTISRFPRIGWDTKPSVMQELETCLARMTEIEDAAGTRNLFWPLGNHDARYETFLASRVPEFQGVDGFHLKDKFPLWAPCWAVWINGGQVVVKHRYRAGIHATHNNVVNAGTSIVTGHLHSLKVTPFTDYNGTRFGVDCGTLACPQGPQFEDYLETNPTNWRSGFAVLTFKDGRMLWPEVAHVVDEQAGTIEFRGQVVTV